MPRTVDAERRAGLLRAVVADLLAHGLEGASLSRLAAASGTSDRMLVHHFGSRDSMLRLALAQAREQELQAARAALPAGLDFLDTLAGAWPWLSGDEAGRYFRLFGQVAARGRLGDDTQPGRPQLTAQWIGLIQDGFAAAGFAEAQARELATLVVAQIRGLILDLHSTGERPRLARAYACFIDLLRLGAGQMD